MDMFKLEYFVITYESASFSEASRKLFVSRQAVRTAIRSLEKELGCTLFTVRDKRLVATYEASRIYEAACDLLGSYRRFEMRAACVGDASPIVLRVGQSVGINDVFEPGTLRKLRHGALAKRMRLTTCSCEQCREGLRTGEFDLVSMVTHKHDGEPEFRCKCGRQGRLYLLVNRSHPLATRESVTMDDLRGMEYDLARHIATEAEKRGFSLNVVYKTPSMYEVVDQVESDCGISYYPRSEVQIYGPRDVACIPFADESMHWYVQTMIARQRVPSELCYRAWETGEITPETLMRA